MKQIFVGFFPPFLSIWVSYLPCYSTENLHLFWEEPDCVQIINSKKSK